ncbi:DUF411 domain-containing protein [Parasphingopyxis lamellibrachiae]|uniref:Metal-binding protein n=1 Tax=Parasphingopyxis lamellibrachiae TaxID=680125 RepID=A0A3D9FDK8_9SPHN|nr:DUF411 domain-containing protein [Parasphingopyxis lamellibrachiae]RED15915.1 hypothetical protein DFR46_0923 [Parasphingopyxis lamellibrachiae]
MITLNRRNFLVTIPIALTACSAGADELLSREAENPASSSALPLMVVYKTPTCGCCGDWIDHLRGEGFGVRVHDVADTTPMAQRLGVPNTMRSCHTAEIDGYAIEGHVPAREIHRLLTERPEAAGLAVPGMPLGSPGMEMGDRRDAYAVLLFDRSGRIENYAQYPAS